MDAARSPDRRLCCGRSQRNKTKRSGKLQVRGALHGHCCGMIARHITRFLGPALIAASSLSAAALAAPLIPSAAAQCPDVQVVFARGTGEPPGVGPTGQAFVDNLRPASGESHSTSIRSITPPATSGTPASTASETRAPMWFRWHTTAPAPKWCWLLPGRGRHGFCHLGRHTRRY